MGSIDVPEVEGAGSAQPALPGAPAKEIKEGKEGEKPPVRKGPVTFKHYTQDQPMLLPPDLSYYIPKNHPVRVVNSVIDSLDLSALRASYKGGGASSYDPAMLLKVVAYCYLLNIFSSRKMEEAVREHVHLMWLAAQSTPDHNTLARFRSGALGSCLREVFSQVVLLLAENGLVSLEESFVDGTKMEANAGRYTFVWGKSLKTKKEKILARLNALLALADETDKAEEKTPPVEFEKLDLDEVRKAVAAINERLKDADLPKEVRRELRAAEKELPERLDNYKKQEQILAGRGSYSKTDHDATFMRMKEDHLGNGQLKPAYNVQISTENQFVTHFSVHRNPADTTTLKSHLEGYEEELGVLPKKITADAGYGSEENYEMLEAKGIEAFVKYPRFHKDQKKDKDPFDSAYWPYDAEADTLTCPAGKTLSRTADETPRQTSTGFLQTIAVYQASGCAGCPFRALCTTAKEDRKVEVNHRLNEHRAKAHDKLTSEEGIDRRKRRCCEVETVFGEIKQNKGFRRFLLRSIEKVQTELGLIFLAHNLRKMAA